MRCTIEQESFIGVLEHFDIVRISVLGGKVNIYCFNKNGIEYEFQYLCQKSEDGIVVFGADILVKKIKSLPGKTVRFKNNVISDSKGVVFHKLPILDDSERPGVFARQRNTLWQHNLSASMLENAIDNVSFCVLSKTDRPVTNNVCFIVFNDSLNSFGFDGYKLAAYSEKADISNSYVKNTFFVSHGLISLLKRWIKGKKTVNVSSSGGWVYFCNEDSAVCFLQQNVELPDFNKILSLKTESVVTFDRKTILECLLSLLSTDDGICMFFSNGKCTFKCFGEDKSSSAAVIEYTSNDNPVDIKINGRFLVDVMRRLSDKKVSLSLGGSSQDPVLVFSDNLKCAMAPMVM